MRPPGPGLKSAVREKLAGRLAAGLRSSVTLGSSKMGPCPQVPKIPDPLRPAAATGLPGRVWVRSSTRDCRHDVSRGSPNVAAVGMHSPRWPVYRGSRYHLPRNGRSASRGPHPDGSGMHRCRSQGASCSAVARQRIQCRRSGVSASLCRERPSQAHAGPLPAGFTDQTGAAAASFTAKSVTW